MGWTKLLDSLPTPSRVGPFTPTLRLVYAGRPFVRRHDPRFGPTCRRPAIRRAAKKLGRACRSKRPVCPVRRSRPRNTRLVQVHTPVQVQPCRAACLIRRAEPAHQQHERLRNQGRSADTYCNIIDGKHGGYGPAPIVSAGMLVVPYVLGGDVNKRKR